MLLRPWILVSRLVEVLWQLGWLALVLVVQGSSSDRSVQQRLGRRILQTLTQLGPCFIKVGQALSTRPDLVRRDWLDQLTELQDNLPPFPTNWPWRRSKRSWGHRRWNSSSISRPTPWQRPAWDRCTRLS